MSRTQLIGLDTTFAWEVVECLESTGMEFRCVGIEGEGDPMLPNRVSAPNLEDPFVLCPISPDERTVAGERAQKLGLSWPQTLVSSSATVASRSVLMHGVFIGAQVAVGSLTTIGCHAVLNRSASVGHHGKLAAFVSVGPGAIVCSEVSIGFGSFIGAGAVVLPEVSIGSGCVVGAGSVVTKDVSDGEVVVGSPAVATKLNSASLALDSCPWCLV